MNRKLFINNCPINEQTANDEIVGRCWFYLKNDKCPRHGDVSNAQRRYIATGELTLENELCTSCCENVRLCVCVGQG